MEFKINTASAYDIENHLGKCIQLFEPALDTYINIPDYSKKLEVYAVTFEMWESTNLIGLIAAYFNDEELKKGFITNVSVVAEYQGKGVASKLLMSAIQYGKEKKFIFCELEVYKSNNTALNLYKSKGFEVGADKGDKLILSLKL